MPNVGFAGCDFTEVKWVKKPTAVPLKQALRIGQVETVKRMEPVNKPMPVSNARKIEAVADAEEGSMVHKTIPRNIGTLVSQTRAKLGMTQKDLATKSQVPEADVKLLEQGKLQHNPAVLQKLQRVLKVKLLGDNIGATL